MKSLSEMSVAELWSLRDEIGDAHRECSRKGIENRELAAFWHAIDDELWARGA